MILIYGNEKVGKGIAGLCDMFRLPYEMRDYHEDMDFSGYDIIIPSPGVPSHHPVYRSGKVKAELDFAYEYLPRDFTIIAVTGTDGKSTTAWILYELLRQEFGEEKVYLSGNFDIPFSATVREILEKKQKKGYIVVEVSSFMSYAIERFNPDYSVFTNLKVDHLNWHSDLEDYARAKVRLIEMTKSVSIVNLQVRDFIKENSLNISFPKNTRYFQAGIFEDKTKLPDWTDGEDIALGGRRKYKLSESHFSGLHNALNILSATIATNEMDICSKRTKKYLENITGLPHRLEFVTERGGVSFIDDSKSTSSQSLIAALTAFDKKKTILIAGGSDKGDTFDGLSEAMQGTKYAVLIGATRDIIAKKCEEGGVPYIFADSMDDAISRAFAQSKKGDTVLLSPGCASFGLFRDYLDRAEKFREAIKKLP